MSSSADTLKKKICVTVFLDELFEEVEDEEGREAKQVSEVTDSEAKLPEKAYSVHSLVDSDNHERVEISPNADAALSQVEEARPRKHRRESKFSKNPHDSVKDELDKYGFPSDFKTESGSCERCESPISDSDFYVDEFLELDRSVFGVSTTSFSELDFTGGSFLSVNPPMVVCRRMKDEAKEKFDANIQSERVLCFTKSTQFDGAKTEEKGLSVSVSQKEEFKPEEMVEEIELILLKEVEEEKEQEPLEEKLSTKSYDLRSILEGFEKSSLKETLPIFTGSAKSTGSFQFPLQKLSDAYTCIFPHDKQDMVTSPPEVKRVWTNNTKNLWSETQESDLSESDLSNSKEIDLCPAIDFRGISSVSTVKFRDDKSDERIRGHVDNVQSLTLTESVATTRVTSYESLESSSLQETILAPKKLSCLILNSSVGYLFKRGAEEKGKTEEKMKEKEEERETKGEQTEEDEDYDEDEDDDEDEEEEEHEDDDENDELAADDEEEEQKVAVRDISTETTDISFMAPVEGVKNFAEGDTFEKPPVNKVSKLILQLESKEELFVCNEILKHVSQTNPIPNEIMVNRAEIEFLPSVKPPEKPPRLPEEMSEVFVKGKSNSSSESQSVMFADSALSNGSENCANKKPKFVPKTSLIFVTKKSTKDVCKLEFKDRVSWTKILRKKDTVEFQSDSSTIDMHKLSTEVVLIGGNGSNDGAEPWHSSLSSLNGLGQCYLKDSQDSSMYLIELPLNLRQKQTPLGSAPAPKTAPTD